MVVEAMAALPVWRELPEPERELLFAAALLHDVAKPACTRVEGDGTVSSRGHSWRGSVMARRILWRRRVPFAVREQIAALVRHHLVPLYLTDREDPRRLAIEVSQSARSDLLAILAEADARGRICPDPGQLLKQVAHFHDFCREIGCLTVPFAFETDQHRFLYFQSANRQPDSPAHAEFRCDAVVLSGLPGSGKDFWLRKNRPAGRLVSLDALRAELKISPSEPQGPVLSRARELAREALRAGVSVVWNATNLSRQIRGEVIRLCTDYQARVRIVYVEVPSDRLFAQNRQRRGRVPEGVIERLLDRWEVPSITEAHAVEYLVNE
jgi:predicted kinase